MTFKINIICNILLILLFAACRSGKQESKEPVVTPTVSNILELSADQVKANDLEFGLPQEYEFTRKVEAAGYLEALPRNKRTITIWTGGTIKNLNLIPGDYVRTGQTLFNLENPAFLQIQEDYLSASELLKYQQDEFERQKFLAAQDVTAKKTLIKAESEYLSTKARTEALKAKLLLLKINPDKIRNGDMVSSVTIPAPISGYVTRINVSNGKYASEQSEIMEITETSPLMLKLSVFEKDITKVNEGQTVKFTIPDVSEEIFEARVEKVGRALDENRTVAVYALFSPAGRFKLLPGMFIKARIISEEFTAMALPHSALIESDGQFFVLVKTNPENDHWVLGKKQVKIGYQDDNQVEILQGSDLTYNDKVVVKGAFSVSKGE